VNTLFLFCLNDNFISQNGKGFVTGFGGMMGISDGV